jgi:hypothetical protein
LTWLPAPIAYSISVAVGDSETIDLGRALMCTTPVWVVTAAGKVPVAAGLLPPPGPADEPELPQAAADTASTAAAAKARER